MRSYFKILVPLIFMLSFTIDGVGAIAQLPNENKAQVEEGDRLQKIKEKGVLTVLSSNNEPYSYSNPKTKEFSGIDADIIKEIAKRLGIKEVVPRYTSFYDLLSDFVKSNDIDMIADGVFITDERKQLVDFTMPLYNDYGGILTRKDSGINRKEDLKNATIGVVRGEVYDAIAQEWKKQGVVKNYTVFFDRNSLKIALESQLIDAILTDSIIEQNIIEKNREANFKLLSPTQFKSEVNYDIGYPVRKEDTTLKNAINEKIQEMKNDGTLYEILRGHGIREHYIP